MSRKNNLAILIIMGVTIVLVTGSILSFLPRTTIKVFATSFNNANSALTRVGNNLSKITTTTNDKVPLSEGGDNHVTIVGIKRAKSFSPSPIDIKVGDSVTWTNNHRQVHTVTSQIGKFDSGLISTGKSFNYRFETLGSFEYYCIIHPSMMGVVNVS